MVFLPGRCPPPYQRQRQTRARNSYCAQDNDNRTHSWLGYEPWCKQKWNTIFLSCIIYSPVGSGCGFDQRTHSISVEAFCLAEVHNVENYPLLQCGIPIMDHAAALLHSILLYTCSDFTFCTVKLNQTLNLNYKFYYDNWFTEQLVVLIIVCRD